MICPIVLPAAFTDPFGRRSTEVGETHTHTQQLGVLGEGDG